MEIALVLGLLFVAIVLFATEKLSVDVITLLPIAMSAARELGLNERTVAIAIMLATSVFFIAPFELSCILVYGPGKYRFLDYVKIGLGLTLILAVVVVLLIPVFWPLC